MKLIHSVHGSVALHVSGDDVVPENGFVIDEFIQFVASTYRFSTKPEIPPGVVLPVALQQLVFQGGVLIDGDKKLAIAQLASVPNGDIVTAATTEIADIILNDYMKRLDDALGYRFGSAKNARKTYQSNIVVQFDVPLEEKIGGLLKIEECLTREIPRASWPFKIKRLSFGYGETLPTLSLEMLDKSDFVIERRAGTPFSENRYFCSAPASTTEHLRVLEVLERELTN